MSVAGNPKSGAGNPKSGAPEFTPGF
jgi:hypothetical protein